MPDVLDIVGQGLELTGLGDVDGIRADVEAVLAVAALVKQWKDVEKPADLPGVKELLARLAEDASDPGVVKVFDQLGIAGALAKVSALLGKAVKAGESVPGWAETLLTQVSKFETVPSGALSWSPVALGEDVTLAEGVKLGGTLGLTLAATAAQRWTPEDGAPLAPLLAVGVKGSIGATASAAVPFSLGSLKAGAKASADVALDYYFDVGKSDALYVVELAKALAQLPDPFAWGDVREAFGREDFAGVSYSFAASTGGNVEVALAKLVSVGGALTLDAGATVSVAASYDRGYRLTLRRGEAGAILASLRRSALESSTLGLRIGVTADLPILRAKVQALIVKALKAWDAKLATIRPFLSPGTYLQGQAAGQADKLGAAVATMLGEPALKDALVTDLKTLFGVDTSADSAVEDWLKEAIKGAIDNQSAKLLSKPGEIVDGVLAQLGDRVPKAAKAVVRAQVSGLVDAAKAALEKAVTDLFTAEGGALGKLLNAAGAGVKDVLADADEALEGVRQILEKYNNLLHDVATKAQAAVEKKVVLAIFAQNKRSRKQEVVIKGNFTDGPGAAAAFKLLTHGDLATLTGWIDVPPALAGFTLDPASQRLDQVTIENKGGYELVVFGFGASASSTLTVDAKVILDAAGNVQVDSEAALTTRFAAGGISRAVNFSSFLDMLVSREAAVAANGRPSVSASIKLGVGISYRDKDFKPKELDAFLIDLETAANALISPESGQRARALLAKWVKPAPAKADVEVATQFWVDEADAVALLRLDQRQNGKLTHKTRIEIAEIGIDALEQAGDISRVKLANAMKTIWHQVTAETGTPQPKGLGASMLAFTRDAAEEIWDDGKFPSNDVNLFKSYYLRLTGLADIVERAGAAYQAVPAGKGAKPDDWDADDFAHAQAGIVEGSRKWLAVNQKLIFWAGDGISPKTLAFMLALERLAGDMEFPVALKLTSYADPDAPVVETL